LFCILGQNSDEGALSGQWARGTGGVGIKGLEGREMRRK